MEVKDVMDLPWKHVTNWSELCASHEGRRGGYFVCVKDVDVFVTNLYRDIARKLNIPYEQLKEVLEVENEAFYSLKKQLFNANTGYGKYHDCLITLQRTLRVPDTSNIEDYVIMDKVSTCSKIFHELSDVEKIAFLQKIGKINVKIEYSALHAE